MSESLYFSSLENLPETGFMSGVGVDDKSKKQAFRPYHPSHRPSLHSKGNNNSSNNKMMSVSPPSSPPVYGGGSSKWNNRKPSSPVSVYNFSNSPTHFKGSTSSATSNYDYSSHHNHYNNQQQQSYYPHQHSPSSASQGNNYSIPTAAVTSDNVVAMDCEFVAVGPLKRSVLARVTIVNYDNDVLLDTFVKVEEKVTDFRTSFSGVNPNDLTSDKAISFGECRRKVMMLLENKVLVGHAIENDLRIMNIFHPFYLTRDTSQYTTFMHVDWNGCFKPGSLRVLARRFLSRSIQQSTHCSYEDATCTMDLYKLVRHEWDSTIAMAVSRSPGAVTSTSSCFCPPPCMPISPAVALSPSNNARYSFNKNNNNY